MTASRRSAHEEISGLLPALLNETLDGATAARARAHVARCAECRSALDAWRSVAAATQRAAQVAPVSAGLRARVWEKIDSLETERPALGPAAFPSLAARSGWRTLFGRTTTKGTLMDTGTPVKGPRRLGDGGRLGAIMAASLGASALIASNSGLAQQVLLRNHIAGTYYQLSNGAVYSSYSGSYGQFYGAQATHTAVPAATATTAPSTGGGDTGGGGASATATTAPSTNNANPLAPGQTGLNPGQSGGTAGPPGQTGANPGQASSQAAGPTIGLTLPSGRIIEVNIPQGLLNNLPPGIRNAMRIDFNPAPVTQNEVQAGSLGGGQVTTVLSPPIDIRITTRDPLTGAPLALTPETLAQVVQVALPILINNLASLPSGSDFQWLRELRDSASGGFLGYVLQPNTFDPGAGVKRYSMTIGDLQGTLFLPTVLTQAWVQNHDPNVHIYSGPLAGDTDFGVAAPQFTTFTVVAPQVGSRLYVFNPRTGNYGWIDVAGIGPAGRPAS